MDLISVIVPVYNVEKYLNRCVDSIINQTYSNLEIILINDGSTDTSGKICDEYKKRDNRIHVIHQKNGGLSAARNAGIVIANGNYFIFVDSDDLIHPQCIEILYKVIKNDCSDIVIGNYEKFDDFNKIDLKVNDDIKYKSDLLSDTEVLDNFIQLKNNSRFVSSCWKLFKKEVIGNIRFPKGRLFEDEFTVYKFIYNANKISIIDKIIYFYYVNPKSITNNLNYNKMFDHFDAMFEQICFFEKNKLNDLYKKSILNFLNSNSWQVVEYRKNKNLVNSHKLEKLNNDYFILFKKAKKLKIISFKDNYDFYVVANTKYILFYRIKRMIYKILKLM